MTAETYLFFNKIYIQQSKSPPVKFRLNDNKPG